ncbi:unnamed protein product [Ambrosiozyma monospora]|uniref:Unnamed protein product n=1 Tax=Ambrosiozyma monospora TaxID=43982 RepID=A0A9W6Z4T1_AMBMO|nr:unnamed protein product [Ambrosiozyma monospora]
MQVKRDDTTRIPNRKPFMIQHYRSMLSRPKELVDFQDINANELRTIIINGLFNRSSQTASLISSWFEMTARSEHHPNVTAPVINYTIASMAPETELYVQCDIWWNGNMKTRTWLEMMRVYLQ